MARKSIARNERRHRIWSAPNASRRSHRPDLTQITKARINGAEINRATLAETSAATESDQPRKPREVLADPNQSRISKLAPAHPDRADLNEGRENQTDTDPEVEQI
ncbi:unnamed protein product [Linum trigynum]|uniref:Uncharacterized protein n=1 Tax=Linum trigynum TaxID=586398 RepID=A0AAV2GJ48_9ROSI